MFPPTTTGRPKQRSLSELGRSAAYTAAESRSLSERVLSVVHTAAEFATLGEAQAPERLAPRVPTAPTRDHPHRRPLGRHPRRRRPSPPTPRAQVCVSPVTHQPARGA
jgi:hypothetical protein